MPQRSEPKAGGVSKIFRLSRTFDAPRELMFRVWTEPEHLMRWWGPKGFEMKQIKMDLRPGGMYLYRMGAPDGSDMWGKFIFREIVEPEKLVFSTSFSDANGGTTRHPWSPTWPLVILSEIRFEPLGDKTEIFLTWQAIDANDVEVNTFNSGFTSMKQGWSGAMDQLESYLATQTGDSKVGAEVSFTRTIAARAELVFDMWVNPKHLSSWFGPRGFSNPHCKLDPKVNGVFEIDMQSPEGEVFANRGIFHEVDPPRHLVFELGVMDNSGRRVMNTRTTVDLEERGGKTEMKVTSKVIEMLPEAAPYVTGMQEGWKQTLDRFEEQAAFTAR
jgi:uncharacterized protein YndB with AHSA1/START domain